MSFERIDKILSHEGFGTRKEIKRLLRSGDVTVNGVRVTDAGAKINAGADKIAVCGKPVAVRAHVYLMMNKSGGAVCAHKDGLHRTGRLAAELHLVGRLDVDTEGLLLFTTDGKLTHRITSPKSGIPKTYFVRLQNAESEERRQDIAAQFAKGIHIAAEDNDGEADCKSASLRWHSADECALTISEGRYHQVKRMFKAVGNEVCHLKRVAVAGLPLDASLAPGEYRELTTEEVNALIRQAELNGA
ncbi:MAG: pseudouridine synthase [Treponema sp.]